MISLFTAHFLFVPYSKISIPALEYHTYTLLCPCPSCSLLAISHTQAHRGRGWRAGNSGHGKRFEGGNKSDSSFPAFTWELLSLSSALGI